MNEQTKNSETEQLIEDFKMGMTYDYLCKKYHHKFRTIKSILDKNNISTAGRDKVDYITQKNIMKKIDKEVLDDIVNEYLKGKSKNFLAKKYGRSPTQIRSLLKKRGISLRPVSNKKYFLNDNFFDEMTHEGAYIIGLLAADGWIKTKDNMISLDLKRDDEEILEKIKKVLELDRPLRYHEEIKESGYISYKVEMCFSSAKIHSLLEKYDVVPNKTYKILHLPKNMPDEFMEDYLRGYFDGDGSICGNSGSWNITSVNKSFLEDVENFLYEKHNIEKVPIREDKREGKNPCYQFFYSRKKSLKKIYEALYYDGCLCMERKRKKFAQIYNNINEIECHEAPVPQNDGTKDMLTS